MAETRMVEVRVAAADRRRLSDLMSRPQSRGRDAEVETVLARWVGFSVEVTPVPEGHTHDGKKHDGLEVHFRRRSERFDPQIDDRDFCYRDPPGCAYLSVPAALAEVA